MKGTEVMQVVILHREKTFHHLDTTGGKLKYDMILCIFIKINHCYCTQ